MAHDRVTEGEILRRGGWLARIAASEADLARALALRAQSFRAGAPDGDSFDATARHVLVEAPDGSLAATFRLMRYETGDALTTSYSADFYDLTPLATRPGPLLELGRFCTAPGAPADALRLAWGALAALVEAEGIRFLFGCTSFRGTDPVPFAQAFAALASHLAPEAGPARKSAETVPLAGTGADLTAAFAILPPLLRSYLAMGGWVSDHAVIDRDLGTIHVFTGLDVTAVPEARARVLRALARD